MEQFGYILRTVLQGIVFRASGGSGPISCEAYEKAIEGYLEDLD